jgi:hypothetical protein
MAAAAVLRGIAADPKRTLKELARPLVNHEFSEIEETQGAGSQIQKLAQTALA